MSYYVERDWITAAGLRAVVIVVTRERYDGTEGERKSHRCGYVAVPDSFSLHGMDYTDLPGYVNVHGGLTFSSDRSGAGTYPVPGDNLHWFGFDCHHCLDAEIEPDPMYSLHGEVRSLEYCIPECESLAKQLMELEGDIKAGVYDDLQEPAED